MADTDDWVKVDVSTELLAKLGEWSEPVRVRIEKVEYGDGWLMVFQPVVKGDAPMAKEWP